MRSVINGRRYRWLLGALFVLTGIVMHQTTARAQDGASPVVVIEVRGHIDLGMPPYVSRVLREAEEAGARAVIVEIDSADGRTDATQRVREAILDSPLRTIAFVHGEARSSGTQIALAADEIYLAPGAVLEETESGQPDANVLLSGTVAGRAELLTAAGLEGAPIVETSPGFVDQAVRIITNPVVAVALIALGVLLLLTDLFTAGFGVTGLLGLGLLATFFWGHVLAGLAGWESVALVALGLVLLGIEVLVIPGFGVAGIIGLAALMGGLFLSLIGEENVTREAMIRAGSTVGVSVITIVAGAAALLWLLPQLPWLRGLVLQTNVALPETAGGRDSLVLGAALGRDQDNGWIRGDGPRPRLTLGTAGVALTDLRPSGYARIDGARVDVVSSGEYIPAGTPIEVIADEGYRRVVRRTTTRDASARDSDVSGVR